MITDNRSQSSFKILTCSSSQLTAQSQRKGKIFYKQYADIPVTNHLRLEKLLQYSHPHILPLHKIQKSSEKQTTTYGLYYEYYVGSLEQFITDHGFNYDQEDIINTFHPILEAVEYLTLHNFQFSTLKLANIVITEDQFVKFVDEVLLNTFAVSHTQIEKSKTFQELSELIFQFLISSIKEKSPKSWKNKIQLLKQKFSKETCNFFLSVFNRSLLSSTPSKKKKIFKPKKHLEGKQNKILQPSV